MAKKVVSRKTTVKKTAKKASSNAGNAAAKKSTATKSSSSKVLRDSATSSRRVTHLGAGGRTKASAKSALSKQTKLHPPLDDPVSWQPKTRTRFVSSVAGGARRAADLLDVAASQPGRWISGESIPAPVQARMLVDLDHVLAHALLVWSSSEVARDWLTTPNVRLDGLRPVDWIRVNGTSEVVEALRSEAAGAFA